MALSTERFCQPAATSSEPRNQLSLIAKMFGGGKQSGS
jgi:hypothetical protein